MEEMMEQMLIRDVRKTITDTLPLSKMEDEELQGKIEQLVEQWIARKGEYCSPKQRASIEKQVFSSLVLLLLKIILINL